jgi:hypothetical protein
VLLELASFTDKDWAKVANWEKHLRNSFMRYYENELQTARQKALACSEAYKGRDTKP